MQKAAELPEPFAAWKLLLSFLLPAQGVVPKAYGGGAIGQVDHATWIQQFRLWQGQIQMLKDAGVAATRLEACHLGGSDIKGVITATEGPCTTTRLRMRL